MDHLGVGVPVSRLPLGEGKLSKLLALRSAETLIDVAALLDTSPSTLIHTLYKVPEASKYKTFEIPKKQGGIRTIHAPVGKLKIYQRVLADLLYTCVAELNAKAPRPPLSHGFRRGLSIVSNASQHKNRRFVLNVDLENFFPTFNFGRVRGFFIKDQSFGLTPGCATIIAQLACFQGALPQGSPCSPIIAELIAQILDLRLVRFAKQHRVRYSRYADDLTFSTNEKQFPEALATGGTSAGDPWVLAPALVDRISSSGFKVNEPKTRMQAASARQTVTGLTVNEKVNISQAYWRGVRSMCHALYETGQYQGSPALPRIQPTPLTDLRRLRGILAHVQHIKSASLIKPPATAKIQFYGQRDHEEFHFYDYFIALEQPLVITEGTTDPIYLRNAIRHLTSYHPALGFMTPDGFKYRPRFFNHESTIARILKITGGSDQIKSFARLYPTRLQRYAFKALRHPVILVLDNDSAIADFGAMAKKAFGANINNKSVAPFYRLASNLYLVKTPELGKGGTSCIEDLFDAKTKSLPLDGKVLHMNEKTFDAAKHIKKIPFAKKIVSANAASIDWSGFDPLLSRLAAAIADYTPPASPTAS